MCCCHLLPELPHKQQFSGQIKTESIDRAAGKFDSRDEVRARFSAGSEANGGALIGMFEEMTAVAWMDAGAGAGPLHLLPVCFTVNSVRQDSPRRLSSRFQSASKRL